MLDPAHDRPQPPEARPAGRHEHHDPDAPRRRVARHFDPLDRRPIWARHDDGYWYAGRLHAWIPIGRSDWIAIVTYETSHGLQYYRDVPSEWVAPNDTGTGHGRRPGVQDDPHPHYDPHAGRVVPPGERTPEQAVAARHREREK